jgi:hypothetical protein
MALVRTTLSSAVAIADKSIVVASATGFSAGYKIRVDGEMMEVVKTYVSGTTIGVLRGQEGSATTTHAASAGVVVGTGTDWDDPAAGAVVGFPLNGRTTLTRSYSAAGAIELPTAGSDMVAVLNGTDVLAMTIAVPGLDLEGSKLTIMANGAAAHTLTFASGLSGAGASYDVITLNGTGPVSATFVAVNALWHEFVQTPMAGTVTNITGTLA